MPDYLTPAEGFLGLAADESGAPGDAGAVVVPFGLEASVSYVGGTAAGPAAILIASHQVELFDEELWCEAWREYGIATLREPAIGADVAVALEQLEALVEGVVAASRFPLTLGGEHSITPGAIRPLVRRHDELVLLHFDAHADLRDGYEGEHYSHASAIRRCLDFANVSVVSLGIRNISAEEVRYLEVNGERIHIHWARDRSRWDLDAILSPLRDKPVYVTVDVDGFDASLMPATGTPEPGGLFWDDVLGVIRAAARCSHIVGADINELAPQPGLHGCDFLAAKLGYKILNYALVGTSRRD